MDPFPKIDTAGAPLPNPPAVVKSVPGIVQSIALCVIFYGLVIAVAIPLEVLKPFAKLSLGMFSSLLIQQVIAWPFIIWVALRWAGVSFREACPLTRFPFAWCRPCCWPASVQQFSCSKQQGGFPCQRRLERP